MSPNDRDRALRTAASPEHRWRAVVLSLAVLLGFFLSATGVPTATVVEAQGGDPISPAALAQIEALVREKESRTGAALKIDSQLLYALKMQRGTPIADGVPTLETDVAPEADGRVELDVTAEVSEPLLGQLTAIGAEVVVAERSSVRVRAALEAIEAIAALPDVNFVQPRQDAVTTRRSEEPQTVSDVSGARLRAMLSAALLGEPQPNVAGIIPPTGQGSRSSEGERTHRAFSARGTFHVDGTGIKIGVLSDGVTNLAASQARGDLGPVTILPGQAGGGDEGTAMLEIIHDIAPGAQLFFATAFTGIASFAQNIRDLRAAGCDIIVDDIFYFVETPFQDGQAPGVVSNTNGGVVIQAVNDVTADGALYFSSAGNSGNLSDGTSGVWEGDFVDGGPSSAPVPVGNLHNFGGQNFNVLTASTQIVNLYWSDPLGGSANDFDLFRLNAAGTAVQAGSTNIQNGTRDPYEQVGTSLAGSRIVILKKGAAAPRFLHLNTNRGRLTLATAGQTHGHNSAADAFGTAAVRAGASFPNPFSGSNVVETFSSDGPRRVFFDSAGSAITPGDFSATGGLVRQKPDITAADGVSVTGVGGFPSPFFGTSAAAPHAAAIAGLIKSPNPAFTPAQIRAALIGSAIDIEAAGVDRDSGVGIIDAYAALQAAGVAGTANLEIGSVTALENPGDANGALDAGEGVTMQVLLSSTGVTAATGVSATLTSTTPGIVITQPNASAYADMAAFNGSGSNATPFLFTIASDAACPLTASFALSVAYTGGPSPTVFTFDVPTGPPPVHITSTLTGVAPAPGPGFTTSAGLQTPRLTRNGIPSDCSGAKPFPGVTGVGTRQYNAFDFTTCANSAPSCVTVSLTSTPIGANPALFSAAYAGSFDPNNLATNYLADPGASQIAGGPISYSFALPGGAQTFVIDVHEVNQGLGVGANYTLDVAGACISACTPPNQLPVARAKDVTVSAGATCTANASIDDGSFDPDGDALTITQSPPGPYPLGTTTVLLTVTDTKGATSQATATVTVVDDTAPALSTVTARPSSLWPPNHRLVNVTIDYTATDNCGPVTSALSVKIIERRRGRGHGDDDRDDDHGRGRDGHDGDRDDDDDRTGRRDDGPECRGHRHEPDVIIVDAHHVKLRAEKGDHGKDRIYVVTVTSTDGAGNVTQRSVEVPVVQPRHRGRDRD